MTNINELLDRERFDTWLRSHNPATNVGDSGTPGHCPLAMYLQCNGVPSASVGSYGRVIEFDDKRMVPPQWVREFVTQIDELADSTGRARDHVKVRAYQAWNILEGGMTP